MSIEESKGTWWANNVWMNPGEPGSPASDEFKKRKAELEDEALAKQFSNDLYSNAGSMKDVPISDIISFWWRFFIVTILLCISFILLQENGSYSFLGFNEAQGEMFHFRGGYHAFFVTSFYTWLGVVFIRSGRNKKSPMSGDSEELNTTIFWVFILSVLFLFMAIQFGLAYYVTVYVESGPEYHLRLHMMTWAFLLSFAALLIFIRKYFKSLK